LGEPDGFAAAAMAEIGLDIARHVPERLDDLEDMGFDLIVTLTPEAHHRALELTRHHPLEVEYWPTEDPTAAMGSREQRLAAYRLVRDALEERILQRFAAPVPAGG
jgi:protein-tyrosine-phosphatase